MRILVSTLFLFLNIQIIAGFALSGTTEILQTGTDANLSGLSGVTGVTTLTVNDITVYRLPNRRLRIQGTLTINPEIEMLVIEAPNNELMIVEGTGHLIIGQAITQNGYTRYSEGTAIYFENTGAGFTNRVSFTGNSSLTWNGGFISMQAGKFGFYGDNVTVRINSTNAKLLYRTQDPQNQIRQETDDFISTGFTLINGDLTIVGTGQQLNGYNAVHCTGSLAFSSATPNVDVPIRNYSGGNKGNNSDIKHWAGSRPILTNAEFGSQLTCGPHISGNASSYGVALVYKEIQIKVVDNTNTPLPNIHYYFRDSNNGGRETYNRESHIVDNTADNIYTGITDVTGNTSVFSVLTAANIANNGSTNAPNTGAYAWDYRGKNNDDSDLFDIALMGYNYNINQINNVVLKGLDTLLIEGALNTDFNISEPSFTNALTISGITLNHNPANDSGTITISGEVTLCELYDYIKAEKINTNKEEPSMLTLVADAVGQELFIKNYKLIFTGSGKLISCDKFLKINSNVSSDFTNPTDNLGIALQDASGFYKLIILEGIDSASLEIYNETTDTTLLLSADTSGTIRYVVQGASDSISILIERTGYTTWGTILSLSTADFFQYIVNQAKIDDGSIYVDPATLANQEEAIFLLLKLIQKNEAILNSLDDSMATTLNIILTTTSGSNASIENQEEILELLHLLLPRTSGTRERLLEE